MSDVQETWILLNELLPDCSPVLVYDKLYGQQVAEYQSFNNGNEHVFTISNEGSGLIDVTHWKKLGSDPPHAKRRET